MVLGWKDGKNSVIEELVARLDSLESKVKLLETENKAQKFEISRLTKYSNNNSNTCTEWRDKLIGNRNKKTEKQIDILNAVGSEQKERQLKERNVVLFGVPISGAKTDEERENEDKTTILEILEEIGIEENERKYVKIRRFKANPNKTVESTNPAPIRVTFDEYILNSELKIEEVLKKSKSLKNSTKFKNVYINKDLTVVQITRLKQLIKTRNEENSKLDAQHKAAKTTATYRYGIRNDMVVKVLLKA